MTSNEIFEAKEDGEITLWSAAYTAKVLASHGMTGESLDEFGQEVKATKGKYNAASVLSWLGY